MFFRRYCSDKIMNLLLKFFAWLPLSVLRYIALFIAFFLYYFPSSMKRISHTNLKLVYPHLPAQALHHLLRDTLKSQCLTYIESIKCWGMPASYSLNLIESIQGEHYLTDAIAQKKGVIIVVAHLGCWELLNAWLNVHAAPMIMYKPNKNNAVNRFILEARERFNAVLVPTNMHGVRDIIRHLRQGGLTVILPDHLPKASGGIEASFFGHQVLSTTLLSKLAGRTQCAVLSASCLRNSSSQFNVVCQPLSSEISSTDLQVSVDYLNASIEKMINISPSQYIWSYKRFRRMQGMLNIYSI
ncbi:lysophospholipid acyltransferase family protein [Acinetobacter sp.]|uniref:lysophospholipid acyltransferase family protein n=1 Tax=Acinetobacter sp. TaxID=472 RepID=UPI0031D06790